MNQTIITGGLPFSTALSWNLSHFAFTFRGLLISLVAALFCAYLQKWIIEKRKRSLPGPFGLPLLGYLPWLDFGHLHTQLIQLGHTYGNVYGFSIGTALQIVLTDLASIKEALVRRGQLFKYRPVSFRSKQYHHAGLVFANGRLWSEQRNFAARYLRQMRARIQTRIEENTRELVQQIRAKQGQPVNLQPYIQRAISNTMLSLLFNRSYAYEDPEFAWLLHALERQVKCVSPVLNSLPWLRHLPGDLFGFEAAMVNVRALRRFIAHIVHEHQQSLVLNDASQAVTDFVHAYLVEMEQRRSDENSLFTVEQLVLLAEDLFLASVDTTSHTLLWSLLYMLACPDVQQRVRAEIERVLTASAEDSGFLDDTWSLDGHVTEGSDGVERTLVVSANVCMQDMPYTRATIMEVLRHSSVTPLAVPHTTLHATSLAGRPVPAHATVLPNLHAVLHSEEYFAEPNGFKPERFLDSDMTRVHKPPAYLPFSLGPRRCLGEQLANTVLFTTFATLLANFEFHPPAGTARPGLHSLSQGSELFITLSPRAFEISAQPIRPQGTLFTAW